MTNKRGPGICAIERAVPELKTTQSIFLVDIQHHSETGPCGSQEEKNPRVGNERDVKVVLVPKYGHIHVRSEVVFTVERVRHCPIDHRADAKGDRGRGRQTPFLRPQVIVPPEWDSDSK